MITGITKQILISPCIKMPFDLRYSGRENFDTSLLKRANMSERKGDLLSMSCLSIGGARCREWGWRISDL